MNRDEVIGRNVQRLRGDAGLRQADLVERVRRWDIRLTQPAVVEIEAGRRALKARELEALAGVLGVPVSMILGERGGPTSARVQLDRLARHAWQAQAKAREALVELEQSRRQLADAADRYRGDLPVEDRAFLEEGWAPTSADAADEVMRHLADALSVKPSGAGAVMTAYLAEWDRVRARWATEDSRNGAAMSGVGKGGSDGS